MNEVDVSMNEWSLTQGMVGYKRIMESYGVNVPITDDGINIKKEQLKILPDAFFYYFLEKYSVAKRHEKVLRSWHNHWKNGGKKYKSELNKRLKEIDTKIGKYFKEHKSGRSVIDNVKRYRSEKAYKEEMDEWLNDIIEGIHTKEIDEKLTCNWFKAVYFQPYFGQPSFLNVTKNSLTVHEQKELFSNDYVKPVLDEWDFLSLLEQGEHDKCLELLTETNNKHPLSSLKQTFKKKSTQEIEQYIDEEILKCSLTDFPLGLFSFEESVFSPLALSLGNSLNITWNSEGENFFPISALAKLLLFCAPAGATVSNGKSVFVQFDGSFDQVYHANEHYYTESDREMSFDEVVFDLVSEQKLRTDMLKKNYLILEYESDYQAKKTLLDYMILTPNLIHLFEKHSKLFGNLFYKNRITFIKYLLKNIDTKGFIFETLRDKIKSNYPPLEVMFMTILRHYNQFYLREGVNYMDPEKQQKYIWVLYKSAENVRNKIGLKKAQGIAYRLLNSVQAGNRNTFMDTVMRVYISSDLEMPSLLLEALHENNMDFETVANAWITGLISKPKEEGEVKNA
ncbi:CRISPR-associated protein Cst1 [Lentibacillus halodurans]|uniref:CRISPR-associated protein Cst1 n=1 Tax=Lentibacillus halodurans TaxID=237679 RepID=A0A1I0WHW1_9BACI|nr:hypothetical protein [Lentibacillus halodurans]SFA87700.1 CRISPR-associated protein Cst1 [Lentibacillus halodurans]